MTDNELITAKLIVLDVMTASETGDKEDIRKALESVKRIINKDGSYNVDIIKYLRANDMRLVWNTVEHSDSTEKRLGLVYHDKAYEINVHERSEIS